MRRATTLTGRLHVDERGSTMLTALLCTAVMLTLGLALLAIVDTQANESADERTRDRGFNLSESVLTSQAFVLGRNWPKVTPVGNPACSASEAGIAYTIGLNAPPPTAPQRANIERLRPNLNASYTDAAYDGATWQVNICDDVDVDGSGPVAGATVWEEPLLLREPILDSDGDPIVGADGQPIVGGNAWDANGNDKVWVRAQSVVDDKTRVVVGLVQVRRPPAVDSKYGLVAGNVSQDLGSATAAITNTSVVAGLTNGLLNTNPIVAEDPAHPAPASGVTGLRCGLLDQLEQGKTCVTGALGGLSALPLFDNLVTGGRYEQFPSASSTTPGTIGQLRAESKQAPGQYIPAVAPGTANCGITLPALSPEAVVFIEKVGNGNQACVLDVGTSRAFKALVVGSGRIVIRGNGAITPYSATSPTNLFTGVVYASNLQNAPVDNLDEVRVEKGARIRGAVHADGKNSTVGLVAPDFSVNALVDGLLCPGLLCTLAPLVKALPAGEIVNALVNGTCLLRDPLLGICLTPLPPLGVDAVLGGITAQLTTYGSAIHSDVGVIDRLKVYGASGVVSGTFRDLAAR